MIDLSRFPPGAFCTVLLADLGADVLQIESTSRAGAPVAAGQVGLIRGKRSVTLDTRNPGGVDVLRRLASSADVIVEDSAPGQMESRGFGYPQASDAIPSLIWCSITGFGQDGPYSNWAGHDLTYIAHGGLLTALNRTLPWHPQAALSVPVGGSLAASGILAALIERERTGKGCQVDISLAEAATWLLSTDVRELADAAPGIGVTPDRRLYECADGEFVSVAAAEKRSWNRLCDALGLADLMNLNWDDADDGLITARLAATFATAPTAAWIERLGPIGAAVGPVNRGSAVVRDPHSVARGSTIEVCGERVPVNPVRLRDTSGSRNSNANRVRPFVGVDTDNTLIDAGYSPAEIASMRESGII